MAEAILKGRGAWFFCLPLPRPDLNPDEMAFPKLKVHLPRIKTRNTGALWRARSEISAASTFARNAGIMSNGTRYL